MLGMIKNSLFGNTEETVYKLLSSETKVGEGEARWRGKVVCRPPNAFRASPSIRGFDYAPVYRACCAVTSFPALDKG